MTKIKGIVLRNKDIETLQGLVKENKKVHFNVLMDHSNGEAVSYVNSIICFLSKIGLTDTIFDLKEVGEFRTKLQNHLKEDVFVIAKPIEKELLKEFKETVPSDSDPDLFSLSNAGKVYLNEMSLLPATAMSVMRLLDFYKIDVQGKRALVIGRSDNVGLPIALGLMHRNALVQIGHSKISSSLLNQMAKESDIVVLASGKSGLLAKEILHDKQVIIDCGYHAETRSGDLGFVPDEKIQGFYTPVPGGVGPLTISTLVRNAYLLKGLWHE